ncbi:unnamed protein product [Nesidiocoris tenuis]|uniref:Uncharacterized protein n=1 Tax=Nesidiocoris tenuis TaxID=355587 RepID=A0A6H5G769_9HEMI|nr:unnamed protein product [Nesidiocoris tenuis]
MESLNAVMAYAGFPSQLCHIIEQLGGKTQTVSSRVGQHEFLCKPPLQALLFNRSCPGRALPPSKWPFARSGKGSNSSDRFFLPRRARKS